MPRAKEIKIKVEDRPGMLGEVALALSEKKVNLRAVNAWGAEGDRVPRRLGPQGRPEGGALIASRRRPAPFWRHFLSGNGRKIPETTGTGRKEQSAQCSENVGKTAHYLPFSVHLRYNSNPFSRSSCSTKPPVRRGCFHVSDGMPHTAATVDFEGFF